MAEINKDKRYLDEATEVFGQATSIWTITESPERGADIQNSLGKNHAAYFAQNRRE